MKSKILILLSYFVLFACNGQEEISNAPIGIGLLETNTEFPISLYKNENDNVPAEILKFKTTKSGVTKFITNLKLKPYEIYEGDSHKSGEKNRSMGLVRFPPILKFRVVDSTKTSFKVVTNENLNESFYIKRDAKSAYYTTEQQHFDNNCIGCPDSNYNPNWNIFETWERYLKRAEYISKRNLKIYDQPNGKVIFEDKQNTFLPFNITEVNGDWIKLKKGMGRESNFDAYKNFDGWTQWKDGNKILIDITEHTYE